MSKNVHTHPRAAALAAAREAAWNDAIALYKKIAALPEAEGRGDVVVGLLEPDMTVEKARDILNGSSPSRATGAADGVKGAVLRLVRKGE